MNTKESEIFANHMTTCAYSEQGCERLPVRMVVEMNTDPKDEADCDFVMLCLDHAALYVPDKRTLVKDLMLVSDDNLAFLKEVGA